MSDQSTQTRLLHVAHRTFTYANVMATLAFIVAIGGTSYAALIVTSKNIKDNTIQSRDLRNGSAVSSADVVDQSLRGTDISNGSITGYDIAVGTITGAEVWNGSINYEDISSSARTSLAGIAGTYTVEETGNVPAGQSTQLLPSCPNGLLATGGGGYTPSDNSVVTANYPNAGFNPNNVTSWVFTVENKEVYPIGIGAYVICTWPTG